MRAIFIHTTLGLALILTLAKISYAESSTYTNIRPPSTSIMDPQKSSRLSMDVDNNGEITKAEYIAHAKKRFARMDINKDQVLSKQELRQYDDMLEMRRY